MHAKEKGFSEKNMQCLSITVFVPKKMESELG